VFTSEQLEKLTGSEVGASAKVWAAVIAEVSFGGEVCVYRCRVVTIYPRTIVYKSLRDTTRHDTFFSPLCHCVQILTRRVFSPRDTTRVFPTLALLPLQHVILFIKFMLALLIPDVPYDIQVKMAEAAHVSAKIAEREAADTFMEEWEDGQE